MPKESMGKTGQAPVVAQGQTTDTRFGSDPNSGTRGKTAVRDLKP
jgi:hypothetical protein